MTFMHSCAPPYARRSVAILLCSAITLLAADAAAQALPEPPPPPPAAAPPPATGLTSDDLPPPPAPPPGAVDLSGPRELRPRVRIAASVAPHPDPTQPADPAVAAPAVLHPALLTAGVVTVTLAGIGAAAGTSALVYECDRHPHPVNGAGCPGPVGDIGRALIGVSVLAGLASGTAILLSLDLEAAGAPRPPVRTAQARREILLGPGAVAARWCF